MTNIVISGSELLYGGKEVRSYLSAYKLRLKTYVTSNLPVFKVF